MSSVLAPSVPVHDRLPFLDHGFDLMLLVDAGGTVLRANAAAFDLLGYAPHELAALATGELAHPDDRESLAAVWRAARGGAVCREHELRWFRRDGRVVWIALSARLAEGGAGAGVILASARDITEHRHAREESTRARARLDAMLESIGDAFFAVDRDWRVTYANRKAASFVGTAIEAAVGRHLLDVAPALIGSEALEHYRDAMATGQPRRVEIWWEPLALWLEIRVYPGADGLSVYFHDITEQRQREDAVRKSEQRYRALFQQAGDSILIADAAMHVVAVNDRACARFGYQREAFIGMPVSAIDGGHAYDANLLALLRSGQTALLTMSKRCKDGTLFPAEVHVSRFDEGGQEYFQAIVRDLSEREEAERQLRDSERRFREVIEMTPSGYLVAGIDGRIRDVNPALCLLTGRSREDLLDCALDALFDSPPWAGLDARPDARPGAGIVAEREDAIRGAEAVLRNARGAPVHVLFNGSVRRGADGAAESITGLMTDITGRKQAESRLHDLATHDSLTGLPNRALLHERLQTMMDNCTGVGDAADADGAAVAVLFLDLDRFKEVNDSFGHELGDILLCEVAARLRQVLRPRDVIARMGGDEFVVAAPCPNGRAGARRIAAKLLEVLTAPVRVGPQEVIIGASIGISMFPHDAGSKDLLFQAADTAMYRAKSAGRNRFRFFEPEMTQAARARMTLEMALRTALARGEFSLHYQPRVALDTMAITGMEALIRWHHPTLGNVPPSQFIGIAEETGMVNAIGHWVLLEACRETRRLIDDFGRPVRVSVNVSARQLAQPAFVDQVRAALADTGLDPCCLELELTESALIEDVERTAAMLHELRALGLKLAVDDFGTGYSGLAYLRRFPVDVLKLDRSFVVQEDGAIGAFDFIKAFVDLAHALRLSVVAEGVETVEVLDFLRAAACDEVQGYLLARPMPLADLRTMLASA